MSKIGLGSSSQVECNSRGRLGFLREFQSFSVLDRKGRNAAEKLKIKNPIYIVNVRLYESLGQTNLQWWPGATQLDQKNWERFCAFADRHVVSGIPAVFLFDGDLYEVAQ